MQYALFLTLTALALLLPASLAPAAQGFMGETHQTQPMNAQAMVTQATQELPSHPAFRQAVQRYRQGDYATAYGNFAQLADDYPEELAYTYYQALAATQLQRYPEAHTLYQNVLWLVPQTPLASLAQQGIQNLPQASPAVATTPAPVTWDAPPVQQAITPNNPSFGGISPQAFTANPYGRPVAQPTQANANANGNLSPEATQQQMQAMMMMQMMGGMGGMGNTGGNQNATGGFNPMQLYGMMGTNPAMGQGFNSQPAMDPKLMSEMMMSQLMGNSMGLGGNDNDR